MDTRSRRISHRNLGAGGSPATRHSLAPLQPVEEQEQEPAKEPSHGGKE